MNEALLVPGRLSYGILVVTVAIVVQASASACRQSDTSGSRFDATKSAHKRETAGEFSMRFVADDTSRVRLVIENGSDNLFVLPLEGESIESLAPQGRWLLYLRASWSASELAFIAMLSEIADAVKGDAKVGIKEYASYDELQRLCPGLVAGRFDPPPFWVLIDDGRVVAYEVSYLSEEQAVEFVKHGFEESSASNKSSIEP
jgi:hypothetical protein